MYAHAQPSTRTVRAALRSVAKKWKYPSSPSTETWLRKMWSIPTAEYYLAVKRNKELTHAKTQMNPKNVTSRSVKEIIQKTTYSMPPFIWNVQIGQSCRQNIAQWLPNTGVCECRWGRNGEWLLTGMRISGQGVPKVRWWLHNVDLYILSASLSYVFISQ